MTVKLPSEIKEDIASIIKGYGYRSEKEFIEDALRRRLLELKKAEFLVLAKRVREKMKKKGIAEKEILKDFERFSHQK